MGTETIPDRLARQLSNFTWVNIFRSALIGALVPRRGSGTPAANVGRLGTTTFPFKNMFVQEGYLGPGDIFPVYDYAGVFDVPQGWMLCNGVIINQANYDAQHSAGDWDAYIVSSVLNGKYLPNMNGNYPIGETGSVQSGASTITTVGTHENDLYHSHSGFVNSNPSRNTYASNNDFYRYWAGSHNHNGTIDTDNDLPYNKNIEPEHIAARFLMRIV